MQYNLQRPGKRGPWWYIRWTDANGRRRERSTGSDTREGAQTFAQAYFGELERRRTPGAGETVGFPRAAEAYKAFANLSALDAILVDRLAAYFSDNDDCRTLTHAHLVGAANALQPGRADSTKNRKVIGPGAAVLHYASGQRWCEYSRIRKFWVSRISNRSPATDATMALLVEHLEDPAEKLAPQWHGVDPNLAHKRLLLAMLYEMGLRLGAYLQMDWSHIDLEARTVAVRVTKSDKMATISFSPVIRTMLGVLPTKTGPLFPWSTSRGVYAWLDRVKERAKVHYTPHLSRHALATAADAAQIPDKRAAELGVWSDPRSLHRYQHVRPDAIPGRDAGFLTVVRAKAKA